MHRWTILKYSRALSALLHDIGVVIIAWVVAYLLRFNFNLSAEFISGMWMNLLWVLPLQAVTFSIFGLYQGVWRFASIPDLKRILKAVGVSSLLLVTIYLMLKPFGIIPRSVLLLHPILLILAMGASRFAYRAWKEHHQYGSLGRRQ